MGKKHDLGNRLRFRINKLLTFKKFFFFFYLNFFVSSGKLDTKELFEKLELLKTWGSLCFLCFYMHSLCLPVLNDIPSPQPKKN